MVTKTTLRQIATAISLVSDDIPKKYQATAVAWLDVPLYLHLHSRSTRQARRWAITNKTAALKILRNVIFGDPPDAAYIFIGEA